MILNVEGVFELVGEEIFVEHNQDNACVTHLVLVRRVQRRIQRKYGARGECLRLFKTLTHF